MGLLSRLLRDLALATLAFGSARAAEPGSTSRRDDTVNLVERVKNSVVNIHSERTVTQPNDDPFRAGQLQPQRVNGMGTGIVLDPRGYIVTNFHVIDDVQSLRVRLCDGTSCVARVIATDKESDLALVKIDPDQAELWARGCDPRVLEARPEWAKPLLAERPEWALKSPPDAYACGEDETRLIHVKEGFVLWRVVAR